jgi:hypothetical protein
MADDDDPGPIVQRLIFGAQMAELREAAGLNVDQANTAIGKALAENKAGRGWYRGKLGKVENGDLNLTDAELDVVFGLYGVSGPKSDEARLLAVEARRKLASARVPDHNRKYVWFERAADELWQYYASSVPGPLQTAEYALAQMSTSLVIPPVDMLTIAGDRVARGDRFLNDPARKLHVVLEEAAVRRPIGGPEVLAGQLDRLLAFAEAPNVDLRVVPQWSGGHAAVEYTFTLLYIARARARIVYVEGLTSADYLARPAHTQTYNLAFESAQRTALSTADTVDLLRKVRDEL